jgi:hypothetical protein
MKSRLNNAAAWSGATPEGLPIPGFYQIAQPDRARIREHSEFKHAFREGRQRSTDRGTFTLVTVEQAFRRPGSPVNGRELPSEVGRILDPGVRPLASDRGMNRCGIAGEEHVQPSASRPRTGDPPVRMSRRSP